MASWKGGPKPPAKVVRPNKLFHAFKHKNFDVFKFDLDAEEDQNYVAASERFLEFQTQLGMVLHHTTCFRKTLEESLQQAVELADDFGRVSAGQGGGRVVEPWAHKAGGQAFFLKGMLEESVASLRQHLCDDLEEKVVRSLREEVANFGSVHTQMLERSKMKMDMLHYTNKVQDLKGSQKATDEKKERNKEKYAQASQALRDQTNQLMSIFAHAEQLRQKLLTQDLPAIVVAEKNAFDSFAINLNKAAAETSDGEARPPRMSDAARIPHRLMPSSDFPTTPPGNALAEVSLDDGSPSTVPPSYSSPFSVKVEPPPAGEVTQTIVKKRSPLPMSPKEGGAPWSSSNGGGEFGEELKRAHEHQNSKMAAETAAGVGLAAAARAAANSNTSDSIPVPKQEAENNGGKANGFTTATDSTGGTTGVPAAAKPGEGVGPDGQPEREQSVDVKGIAKPTDAAADDIGAEQSTVTLVAGGEEEVSAAELAEGEGIEGDLEPGKMRLRALYDYDATQDGDLSFNAGDVIITNDAAFSGEGWISGSCRGNEGVFPANYTEPW